MRPTVKPFVVESRKRRRPGQNAQPLFTAAQLAQLEEPAEAAPRERTQVKAGGNGASAPAAARILPDLTFNDRPDAHGAATDPASRQVKKRARPRTVPETAPAANKMATPFSQALVSFR